jgi:hypothetical protein
MGLTSFEELKQQLGWAPIRGCPGRFILRLGRAKLRPEELVGPDCELKEFRVDGAPDVVVTGRLVGGGLISYKKSDGTYLHTLNTEEGFERKLAQLEINL